MAESSQGGRAFVSRHVKRHQREGMGQDQAVAAALSEARRKGKKVSPRRRKGGHKAAPRRGKKKMTRTQAARKAGKASARARKKRGQGGRKKKR